jgi:peroxiredoxin
MLAPALLPAAEPEPSAPVESPSVGDPAPVFPVPDLRGDEVDLPGLLRGKVGLVAFWTSWCPPCLEEVPTLRLTYRKFRKAGLVVVGVGLSQGGDTILAQRAMARRYLMDYVTVFDEGNEFKGTYGLRSIPWNMIVARDGRLAWQGNLLPGDLEARLQALLAEEDPGEGEGR